MNVNDIFKSAKGAANRSLLIAKKHSPKILLVTGIITGVAASVVACKETVKAVDIFKERKETLEKVQECVADKSLSEKYSEEDAKKDVAIVNVQTGVKLAKVYAPAIGLGALSIVCLLASYDILNKRNVALAAAYEATNECFKNYRDRVIEKFGEDVEKKIRYNMDSIDIIEFKPDENGETVETNTTVDVVGEDPSKYSPYAKFFDETSSLYEKDSEYNLMLLRSIQAQANDRLIANKYLFLNEVYEMLGLPKTKAGQIVGWVYNPEHPIGDNYVDFGIYDMNRPNSEALRNFVNGVEPSILLDFNVDGNIWDLM